MGVKKIYSYTNKNRPFNIQMNVANKSGFTNPIIGHGSGVGYNGVKRTQSEIESIKSKWYYRNDARNSKKSFDSFLSSMLPSGAGRHNESVLSLSGSLKGERLSRKLQRDSFRVGNIVEYNNMSDAMLSGVGRGPKVKQNIPKVGSYAAKSRISFNEYKNSLNELNNHMGNIGKEVSLKLKNQPLVGVGEAISATKPIMNEAGNAMRTWGKIGSFAKKAGPWAAGAVVVGTIAVGVGSMMQSNKPVNRVGYSGAY